MSEYTFVINATISLSTTVQADSLSEAIEVAQSRAVQGLCHQCSGGRPTCEWGTEIDCEPLCDSELVDLFVDGETVDIDDTVKNEWSGSGPG